MNTRGVLGRIWLALRGLFVGKGRRRRAAAPALPPPALRVPPRPVAHPPRRFPGRFVAGVQLDVEQRAARELAAGVRDVRYVRFEPAPIAQVAGRRVVATTRFTTER
jgi:hypothetical protein